MVTKLAEMKVKQELLVADKRKNVFNTIGTGQNFRSRSAGNQTHRSAATFMRAGSEEANIMIKLQKNNSQSSIINEGIDEANLIQMPAGDKQQQEESNQVSYRYLQETQSSAERQKAISE